ncbi:hypothetical protein MPEAHAMD_7258 [Methylobacterium frigidaeris]|uniref:Uncharacterized protein n=1 Tax=Methylobacterium frigidaeris TaxID=2038277 RepID=A0AA37HK14_9HYPH|nr:hypothetical protein MPEAHAMD_7258 [Methylobacterium frigidaeris]
MPGTPPRPPASKSLVGFSHPAQATAGTSIEQRMLPLRANRMFRREAKDP